jgi:hypothetical protein
VADYWNPPSWKLDQKLRTTFDSLRKALNVNLDDVFDSLTGLLSFQASAEGVWTAYTPTNVNVTVGNGVQVAEYKRIGKTVFVSYFLLLGSTTAFAGSIDIGLPVAARASIYQTLSASYVDSGTREYTGSARLSGSVARLVHSESGNFGVINGTNPFTWTTSDSIHITGVYQAA